MDILKYIALIDQAINENASEIEGLDRAIGDGDHFINLKRGITTILSMTDQLSTTTVSEQFKMIGMKVLSTVGGASGPLFATFFWKWVNTSLTTNHPYKLLLKLFPRQLMG